MGGNVGLLVQAVPRWLTIGASYRSAVDLDLAGTGTPMAPGPLDQAVLLSLPLPHAVSLGVSSTPWSRLTLDLEAHVSFWSDLQKVTLTFTDGNDQETERTLDFSQRNAWGLRLGAELRPVAGLWLAAGLAYDRTPVRRGWLQVIAPDNDRVTASAGLGYRYRWLDVGAAYAAEMGLSRTGPGVLSVPGEYRGLYHVVSLAVGIRLPGIGGGVPAAYEQLQ
jgi:long-chain fatty acid transport protein